MDINKLLSSVVLTPLILFSALSFGETEEELEKRINNLEVNVRVMRGQEQLFKNSIYDYINQNDLLIEEKISHGKQNLENYTSINIDELERKLLIYFIEAILGFIGVILTIYFYLKYRVAEIATNTVKDNIDILINEGQAKNYRSDALTTYELYDLETDIDKKNKLLNRCINLAELSMNSANKLPDKDKYHYLQGISNNNYAAFVIEGNKLSQLEMARKAAEKAYIISLYEIPGHNWYRWRETQAWMLVKYKRSLEEKLRGKNIAKLLCENRKIDNLPWKQNIYKKYKTIFDDFEIDDTSVVS